MVGDEVVPRRGDIVWLRFNEQAGHEQAGRRPTLKLSPRRHNERSRVALASPIKSRVRAWPFKPNLPPNGPVKGVMLANRFRNVDWRNQSAQIVVRAPRSVLAEVLEKVRLLLD